MTDDSGAASGRDGIGVSGSDHTGPAGSDDTGTVGPDDTGTVGPARTASRSPTTGISPSVKSSTSRGSRSAVGRPRCGSRGCSPRRCIGRVLVCSGRRPTRTCTSRPPRCCTPSPRTTPVVDGNKRTAWLAAATFLAVNGVDPAGVDQDRAYDLVIAVASGEQGDVGVIAEALRGLAGQPV